MKVNDLGKIIMAISKAHGDEPEQVVIDGIKYEKGKSLHVSTSSDSMCVIASVILDTEEK